MEKKLAYLEIVKARQTYEDLAKAYIKECIKEGWGEDLNVDCSNITIIRVYVENDMIMYDYTLNSVTNVFSSCLIFGNTMAMILSTLSY